MEVLVGIVALMVINAVAVRFGRRCQDNMGHNIGKKHMKETWGIEEKIEFHE